MNEFIGYYICGILVMISVIISIVAQFKVNGAYNKYKDELSPLDMTGRELAYMLSKKANIAVSVASTSGMLTDHYNPTNKSLNISNSDYNSKSIAAHAIVAHEFGHAMQDAENYFPFKVRQTTVRVGGIISKLLIPMIILGLLLEFFVLAGAGNIILYISVGSYFVSCVINRVTLPVEFNASKRAKELLSQCGVSSQAEMAGVHDVLNAAAMTYVASTLVSLAYLLRILSIIRIFSRD